METSTKKILVIEDEKLHEAAYKSYLEKAGYNVAIAATCEEGIEKSVWEKDISLIILDIILPSSKGMDGWGVLTQLKVDPETAKIPVLVISALEGEAFRKTAEELGAAAFITKSAVELKQVLEEIKMLLG